MEKFTLAPMKQVLFLGRNGSVSRVLKLNRATRRKLGIKSGRQHGRAIGAVKNH